MSIASSATRTRSLASLSDRFFAQLLDGVIALLPLVAAALLSNGDAAMAEMLFWGGLALSVLYYMFADSMAGGQSFGKRALEIAVVDKETLAPCSPGQSFVRNLLLGILGFFDWVFILGNERRRLGDRAAGTIVVEAVRAHRPGLA